MVEEEAEGPAVTEAQPEQQEEPVSQSKVENVSQKPIQESVAVPIQVETAAKEVVEQVVEEPKAQDEVPNEEIASTQNFHKEGTITIAPQPSERSFHQVAEEEVSTQDTRKIEHVITLQSMPLVDVAQPNDVGKPIIPPTEDSLLELLPEDVVLLGEQTEVTEKDESAGEDLRRKVLAIDEIAQLLQQPLGMEFIVSLMENATKEVTVPPSLSGPTNIFPAPESGEAKKVNIPEIAVVRQGETIIVEQEHAKKPDLTNSKEVFSMVEPIATVDAFSQAIDAIAQLLITRKDVVPGEKVSNSSMHEVLLDIKKTADTAPTQQQEKTPEITVQVSDEILTSIDTGAQLFQTLKRRRTRGNGKMMDVHISKTHMVRVVSAQKEIIIELEMLKKLIELHKMKGQIASRVLIQKNETALEELGLHPMKPQWDDMVAFWFVYQLVVFFLTSIEDTQLFSYDRIVPRHVTSPVLHA